MADDGRVSEALSPRCNPSARGWLSALPLVVVSAAASLAQAPDQVVQLRGRTIDSLTSLPIAGATVEIGEKNLRQVSDSGGRFVFGALPPGRYVMHVYRLGYLEAIDTVGVQAGQSVERDLLLRHVPTTLGQIVVSGRPVTFPRFLEPVYKRAAAGRGYFITHEQIEEANATDYQMLLSGIPGVHANDRGVTFERCQLGLEKLFNPTLNPKVQVYIDGHRMSAIDSGSVYEVLRLVKPQSVQIIEIYPGVASIPGDFLSDACAVIAIWTKRS